MKRILCTLLLLSFALSLLCACNDTTVTTAGEPSVQSPSLQLPTLTESEEQSDDALYSKILAKLPAPEEEIYWYQSPGAPDASITWQGITGDGTLDSLGSLDENRYIALRLSFVERQASTDFPSSKEAQKEALEAEGLFVMERTDGGFFCFATTRQMGAMEDKLKGVLFASVTTKERFLNEVVAE